MKPAVNYFWLSYYTFHGNIEYLAKHLPKVGGTVLQAEDEIGAINMCYGAAATGTRVMTASSSPGISLKQEGLSYVLRRNAGGNSKRQQNRSRSRVGSNQSIIFNPPKAVAMVITVYGFGPSKPRSL